MSGKLVVPPDAAARQRAASDPTVSAWVSANAGAGKTKVLTDRVIRLMLAGSPPSRILCLTFTKAAAAEMTSRVFATLGDWVTLDDAALSRALEAMTGEPPRRPQLDRARRLFARAVETPGGLKIETIHAFCERLLHLVPFEAGVPPRFVVLDESQAAEALAEARAATLIEAASAPGLGEALETVAAEASGDALVQLLAEALAEPTLPQDEADRATAIAALSQALGLRADDTPEAVRRAMVEDGIPPGEWPAIAAELEATGQALNRERAAELRQAIASTSTLRRAAHYQAIFLTGTGTPQARLVTKKVPEALRAALEREQERIVALRETLLATEALARTEALYRLASAIRSRYEALKRRLGALDFADLIERTERLFEGGAAPWVLYRLDRGIDHVLVDEAQDTNSEQWRILRRITEDFTAGAGRPVRAPRTIFAVGDPKQSIYSFQGADPLLFEESRRHWRGLHERAGLRFADIRLLLSFRSAPAVLRGVDATFAVQANFRGLSSAPQDAGTQHDSARPAAPGEIEIWPTEVPAAQIADPDAWSLPVDLPDAGSPALVAARRVAEAVRSWISGSDPRNGRRWRPGDILILARRRGPAFFAAIRALKAAGVPVAGADRIDIAREIAVNDLVAVGQAAILPGHDLALAAALKSPLVGLDDDDLVRIGADRPDGMSLEAALERAAAEDPRAANAVAALATWRAAAHLGPFGFYAALLGPGGGRRLLVERLGGEAQDAIDTFLCRAEAEESALDAPSLTGFLSRFEASEHVIKRDPEGRLDEVRVMTVHGAKGLEAPLVVLLDGCEVGGRDPRLLPLALADGTARPVWAPRRADDPRAVGEARAAWRARALEEHNRLLYVALTRARDRLVLVQFTGMRRQEPEEAWCRMVRRGLEAGGHVLAPTERSYGPVGMLAEGGPEGEPDPPPVATEPLPPPAWLHVAAAPEPESAPPLRPSGALAAADRTVPDKPARNGAEQRRRGVLAHALVQHLADAPTEERAARAERFLLARAPALEVDERARVATDMLGLLDHPALAPLFGPGSRSEVAIAGTLGEPGRERAVSGQIDRLAIGAGQIVVADFKTGAPPAGRPPPAYVTQIAIYAALLRRTHPGFAIRALLVWAEGPVVVELEDEAIAAAVARVLEGTGSPAAAVAVP